MNTRNPIIRSAAIAMSAALLSGAAFAAEPIIVDSTIVSGQQMDNALRVHNVTLDSSNAISGVIVNNTGRDLKDVKLAIEYQWLWNNEFSPGDRGPGQAIVYAVEDVPAGAEIPFTVRPSSPLQPRTDGHFVPFATVLGYTQDYLAAE